MHKVFLLHRQDNRENQLNSVVIEKTFVSSTMKNVVYVSHAAIVCITQDIVCSDDDTQIRANMKHSYEAIADRDTPAWKYLARSGRVVKRYALATKWPKVMVPDKKKPGQFKPQDYGLLPLYVEEQPSDHIADPTHRTKCMAKPLYDPKIKGTTKSSEFTKADAGKIKRDIGYTLRDERNQKLPYDEHCKACRAPALHHYDDHSCCRLDWCVPLQCKKDKVPVLEEHAVGNKFRSKEAKGSKFKQVQAALKPFLTEKKLLETRHHFNSQKVESCHKKTTASIPKDQFLGRACGFHDLVSFVVIMDKVGHKEGLSRIWR